MPVTRYRKGATQWAKTRAKKQQPGQSRRRTHRHIAVETTASRFWREGRGQQPSEDRIEGHGEQIATRQAALSYAPCRCELPSSCAGMHNIRNGVSIDPPKEELQGFQDAGPLQHHEDSPEVDAGVGAGEVGEQDAEVFRVTGAHGDGRRFDLKEVVCHDMLGDAPLGRVNVCNRVSSQTCTHGRCEDFAVTITKSQRPQRYWHRSAGTEASRKGCSL